MQCVRFTLYCSVRILYVVIHVHGKYMLSIITNLNHELHTLSTWLKANKLNTDKTYYIIYLPHSNYKTARY